MRDVEKTVGTMIDKQKTAFIAFLPYHLFTDTINQHFHGTAQHYSPKEAVITKVNTGMTVPPILCNTH